MTPSGHDPSLCEDCLRPLVMRDIPLMDGTVYGWVGCPACGYQIRFERPEPAGIVIRAIQKRREAEGRRE